MCFTFFYIDSERSYVYFFLLTFLTYLFCLTFSEAYLLTLSCTRSVASVVYNTLIGFFLTNSLLLDKNSVPIMVYIVIKPYMYYKISKIRKTFSKCWFSMNKCKYVSTRIAVRLYKTGNCIITHDLHIACYIICCVVFRQNIYTIDLCIHKMCGPPTIFFVHKQCLLVVVLLRYACKRSNNRVLLLYIYIFVLSLYFSHKIYRYTYIYILKCPRTG